MPSISQRGEQFQLYKLRVKLTEDSKIAQPNGETNLWSLETQKILGTLPARGPIATYQTKSFDRSNQELVIANQNNDSDN